MFRQPSGSDEGAGAISLQGSQKRLRAGYDPIASGLSRIAVRGRPFLSERTHHNRFCYYKGGLGEAVIRRRNKMADYALANPPYALYALFAFRWREAFPCIVVPA
ncbi:MAG: hypothetical protein ACJ8EK_02695 [Bradyrhizobium sp.]